MSRESRIIAGAMSGTSADGVDVALVSIAGRGLEMRARMIARHHRPFPPELREKICTIRSGTPVSIGHIARCGREISLCYALAVNEVLAKEKMNAEAISAVAAHGQTLFHDPPDTVQWLDPALIAAEVGCAVVSDFRRADGAAGGQGAPLVPLADYLLFRDEKQNRVLLNIGGIANLTYLPAGGGIEQIIAFDTGPGNCLSDQLMRQFDRGGAGWDEGGQRAAAGTAVMSIVKRVLGAAYFGQLPPKSTDGPAMIKLFEDALAEVRGKISLEDLLATACTIAADAVLESMRRFLPAMPDEIVASGGGIQNRAIMGRLRSGFSGSVKTIDDVSSIPSDAKEAAAFALLGAATLDGFPGNVPSATGAKRAVVLGAVTPKP
jgi:anhydro-N-acetylmuramic acid kinase